jgi:hypothetical protein
MIFTVAVRVFIVWFYNNTGKSVFAAPSSMIWSTSVMAYFLTTACIMPVTSHTAVITQTDLLIAFIEPFLKGETPKGFME